MTKNYEGNLVVVDDIDKRIGRSMRWVNVLGRKETDLLFSW